jgi:hypothetical protein
LSSAIFFGKEKERSLFSRSSVQTNERNKDIACEREERTRKKEPSAYYLYFVMQGHTLVAVDSQSIIFLLFSFVQEHATLARVDSN